MEPTVVDESQHLRFAADVNELRDNTDENVRCILLGPELLHDPVLNASVIGPKGGSVAPDWWQEDPAIERIGVSLCRIRDVFYFPKFGVLLTTDGRVMQSTFREAEYVLPNLIGLPGVENRDGKPVFHQPRDVPVLHRASITVPWGGIHNYGHFVLDCLRGAVAIQQTGLQRDYGFVSPSLTARQKRHFELVTISNITELQSDIYFVEDALFTNCMDHFLHRLNVNLLWVRDRQLARARSRRKFANKLYLTRAGKKT
jgi:capsular polysaccharide biosynthesis protein